MYDTDHHRDRYCLLYYVHDSIYYVRHFLSDTVAHQIIPYCLRPSSEESILVADFNFNNTIGSNFSFAELREKNIDSQLLVSWSAPIDLIERYQIFLNNPSIPPLSEKETLFYNCTEPWFGPLCRFAFNPEISTSLNEFVGFIFRSKLKTRNVTRVTCYLHLNCQRDFLCLDWREICDGKIDCSDGSDEWNCWQLEINECTENEYRCRNGQCIPHKFLHDAPFHPDCLDRTDEPYGDPQYPSFCHWDPAFRCEEHTCRPGKEEFPCGDGVCTSGIDSCFNGRDSVLHKDHCSYAIACLMEAYGLIDLVRCKKSCMNVTCVTDNCPDVYEFASRPILFGHISFIFLLKEIKFNPFTIPFHICYDDKFCAEALPASAHDIHFRNLTCRPSQELGFNKVDSFRSMAILVENVKGRFRSCLLLPNQTDHCNYSTMYQCTNSSKCISKYHLVDGIQDCPFGDDETFNQSCSLKDAHHRITCTVSNNKTCFTSLIYRDSKAHCQNGEDELQTAEDFARTHISFQTICDGKTELSPVLINGQYETDETECEYWSCNNTYSRCDGYWLCKNGADEINCPSSRCPPLEHDCVFLNDTSKVACLPIARADDGIIDCLGATDERNNCRVADAYVFPHRFGCRNSTKCYTVGSLCDGIRDCRFGGDDEAFCRTFDSNKKKRLCIDYVSSSRTETENFFCSFQRPIRISYRIYFKLDSVPMYPFQLTSGIASLASPTDTKIPRMQNSPIDSNIDEVWRCNRGLPIHIRMMNGTSELYCLCPPSYYGNKCQYQNQRVSLTIQIRATSSWRSVFTFAITLIDNEYNIESYDHIEYSPIRDCDAKFHVYLLYSTRPKNLSKNYSVRIDVFDIVTLNYRGSWSFALEFPFLPVHRLAVLLTIPAFNVAPLKKCTLPCIHGQCFNYLNLQSSTFCRCEPGWSGLQCTEKYMCDCASNSLCIDDSICVCPLDRFGPRCHIFRATCYSESCANDGQCISTDKRHISSQLDKPYFCICREGYSGEYCERRQNQTQINVSFDNKLTIPPFLFIHFITVRSNQELNRTSTMKKIAFDQYSVTFYISITFNIAFVEIFKDYYLIIVRKQAIISDYISREVHPSYRCASIHELFNESLANQPLLKRIKYYHLPCQQRHKLVCFYDSIHFCLCDSTRNANCFEFDHNVTYDCSGYNLCENGGYCFQDDQKCPTSSVCACRECYYGSRCQFSTKGSSLSLNIIMGYRIRSNTGISQQPIIVKIAIILITVIFCLGFLSNLLSFLIFRMKNTRTVGCGLYLFASSIISMITMIVLIVKFWLLLATQMGSIENQTFIYIQCISIDFLLQLLLGSGDWLRACVATERAMNVWKGISFDKQKSKYGAKWIILIVVVFTTSTYIYDPMSRSVSYDEGEQRTWCVTEYSSFLQLLDWTVNIFHFSFPFFINCISALVIIIVVARVRSNAQKSQPYKKLLQEQFQQHKFLLISPCILIVLAVPRLILLFSLGCMKSARDSWFYLIGYFISFVPSMLTLVVFVLPSENYRKEFIRLIKSFRKQ